MVLERLEIADVMTSRTAIVIVQEIPWMHSVCVVETAGPTPTRMAFVTTWTIALALSMPVAFAMAPAPSTNVDVRASLQATVIVMGIRPTPLAYVGAIVRPMSTVTVCAMMSSLRPATILRRATMTRMLSHSCRPQPTKGIAWSSASWRTMSLVNSLA